MFPLLKEGWCFLPKDLLLWEKKRVYKTPFSLGPNRRKKFPEKNLPLITEGLTRFKGKGYPKRLKVVEENQRVTLIQDLLIGRTLKKSFFKMNP